MKKRLLSAALALVMVLTLLPATALPAFAASPANSSEPESGKTTVQYIAKDDYTPSRKPKDGTYLPAGWAWQYKDADGKTYWTSAPSLPNGLINGTGTSGVWYSSNDFLRITDTTTTLKGTSFTLTGDVSLDSAISLTTLSVNLFGHKLTIGPSLAKVNSLTITDTWATTYNGTAGEISGNITRNVASYITGTNTMSTSGLTLRITGANVNGGISLYGRANSVYLTGVSVTGGITMDGTTTVTTNGVTAPSTYERQTLEIKSQASSAANGVPFIQSNVNNGAISITGNNSSVNLTDVKNGGALTVTSTGGSVNVNGESSFGAVTIGCGKGATSNQAPASLTISDSSRPGGTVTSVTRTDADSPSGSAAAGSITVNLNGEVTNGITTNNGTVTINSGKATGNVKVDQGTVTISGSNANVGNLNLANGGKTTLNVTGTGHNVGDISAVGGNLTIGNNWPTGRTNTFGDLSLNNTSDYKGQGIKGGIFKTQIDDSKKALWFDPDLQFMRDTKNSGYYAYYGRRELSQAIADAGSAAADQGTILVTGAKNSSNGYKYVKFYNSALEEGSSTAKPIAQLGYGAMTAIYLPDKINGTPVATWTNRHQPKTYSVNEEVSLDPSANEIRLVIQSNGGVVSKLTNATIEGDNNGTNTSDTNPNRNVTVTLSGNQINLSGAVSQDAYAGIRVQFTTDLIGPDGKAVTFVVPVAYNTTSKTATFNTLGLASTIPYGVTVNNTTIVVGNNTYTLNTSGLARPASELEVDYSSKEIVVTVSANMTEATKQMVIDAIKGSSSTFDWENSPAIRQAVNAAIATITSNNSVDNWINAAQRAAWNLKNTGTPTAQQLSGTGFTKAWLVPYLAVNVTAYNANGTMTATMTPSYRVEVRGPSVGDPYYQAFLYRTNGTANGDYLAQPGRSLGTLMSDLTGGGTEKGVELTLNALGASFSSAYAVQDDTYVYQLSSSKMTITHAGKNNTGLGTLVFSQTNPLMTLNTTDAKGKAVVKHFNNLQAAVDDAKDGDTLTVHSAYTGSGVINVTGTARKFTIVTEGNTTITPANNNFTVNVDPTGHTYIVQLQKNVTPVGGNITVTDVTGGTASVNVNPATVGQTVTITLRPNTGYVSNGVTVRTNATTGTASTTVPVTGSGNSYTFTMPAGSVTVTPAFRQGQTQTTATVTVSNSGGMGTTTTTAASTNNQATPGSVVGVYTTPASGYRTMSVNVSTNGSGTTAVRQGDNYFTFTVPSNATAVTVTPVYDRDNGTKFSDVWSTEYYSNPVAWAVSSGVTDGTSTYTFSPSNYCTRAQMVTFLWRAEGRPSVANIRNPFVDVSPTLTPGDYYSAILWAVSKGITDGKTPTRFAPNDIVTRGQAVTFLYRYENKPAAGTTSQFYDVPSSEYYARPVSWAANRAVPITTGKTNTMFDPNSAVTRAQAVTFLYRDKTNKLA